MTYRAKDALLLVLQNELAESKDELHKLKLATEDLTPTAEFDGKTLRLLLPKQPRNKNVLVPDKRVEIIVTARYVDVTKLQSAVWGTSHISRVIPTGFEKSCDAYTINYMGPTAIKWGPIHINTDSQSPAMFSSNLGCVRPPFGTIWTPRVRARFKTALDNAWETFSTREINT